MNKIYLDNAATTPLNEQVIEEMLSVMRNHYGNPSSTHSIGQEAKTLIENARRKIAEYLRVTPGEIIDRESDQVIGVHDGAVFYTIGQRHGLNLSGGLPYYIVDKDMSRNIIYVSRNLNNPNLWTNKLMLKDIFLRPEYNKNGEIIPLPLNLDVRIRHRAALQPAKLTLDQEKSQAVLEFTHEFKRPASGQSAVFYHGNVCLGGGIIA